MKMMMTIKSIFNAFELPMLLYKERSFKGGSACTTHNYNTLDLSSNSLDTTEPFHFTTFSHNENTAA
jgi:hypothetical protein